MAAQRALIYLTAVLRKKGQYLEVIEDRLGVDHRDESVSRGALARGDRGPYHRRPPSRQADAQRSQDHAQRRIYAKEKSSD